MYIEINKQYFIDAFKKMGRENQFSYEGLSALYDFFVKWESEMDETMKLDVVAICCEYTEYKSIEEFWNDFDKNSFDKEDYPDIDAIKDLTLVIEFEGGFIVQDF